MWAHLHHTPRRLAHIVMNTFKRRKEKKELAAEKVILGKKNTK
jgi:hypothetical protein